jgi:hypothetical protein
MNSYKMQPYLRVSCVVGSTGVFWVNLLDRVVKKMLHILPTEQSGAASLAFYAGIHMKATEM